MHDTAWCADPAHHNALHFETATAAIDSYLRDLTWTIAMLPTALLMDVVQAPHSARPDTKNVFIMGNGGSSATASHFACDLAKGTLAPGRPRFRAIALKDNVPLLTAWANDTEYENIFADQPTNLAGPGDVLMGISGSGNSHNVLKVMVAGQEIGAVTIDIDADLAVRCHRVLVLTGKGVGQPAGVKTGTALVYHDCVDMTDAADWIIGVKSVLSAESST